MVLSVTPKRTGVFLAITRPTTCVIHGRSIEDVVPDVAPLTNNSHLYCFTLFIGRTLPTTRKMTSCLLECLPFQWNFPSPRRACFPQGCATGIPSPSLPPQTPKRRFIFYYPKQKPHVLTHYCISLHVITNENCLLHHRKNFTISRNP